MLDLLLISLVIDETTIRAANVKLKVEKIIGKNISEDHDGLLNKIKITLIDKTDPSDQRRKEY